MDRKTYDLFVRAVTEEKRKCLGETMTVKELLDLGWNSVRLRWANDNIPTALLYKDCDDEYSLDDEIHNPLQEKVLDVVVKVDECYDEDADGFPIVYCDELVSKTESYESYYKKVLAVAKENKIEIIDLEVAYEISCCVNEDIPDKKFDEICSLIKDTYLKYEELTLWSLVNALLDMVKDQEKTLESFDLSSVSRRELGDKASYYL